MFVRIDNVPRDYAWGSRHGIADLLGRAASGAPEAELWLGAHPGSPSRIVNPVGAETTLPELIGSDAVGTVGPDADGRLPFLLKVLSAASPLSLQAHPSTEQARVGFARENAIGVPVDAPQRNYKDPFHKPELIVAVTPFDALCGFRGVAESMSVLDELIEAGRDESLPHDELELLRGLLDGMPDAASALRAAVGLLLGGGDAADEIVAQATAIADSPTGGALDALDVVRLLASDFPGDPGVVLALFLNRVRLRVGEALYLPAGNIHAYLSGTGIELMAASDNVLRGGLTKKHIDVPELLHVLDFAPVRPPLLAPVFVHGVEVFRPDVPDFELAHLTTDASLVLTGPAIVLCTAGTATLSGEHGGIDLGRGQAVFVSPDERELRVKMHDGELFAAQPNG